MSVELMVEQRYDQICQKILCPGMRKIAMTYSVSNSVLYDTLHDCDIPDYITDLERDDERDKSYLRLRRILKRLKSEDAAKKKEASDAAEKKEDSDAAEKKDASDAVEKKEASAFATVPKVFDAGMYVAMTSSYETIVDQIGDRSWFVMLPARYMDVLEMDGRSKLTFVEMTALSSLYMALRGRAVEKLNYPLDTANQVKRGKLRVKKIMDALHSTELHQSLVRSVFDLLVEVWKDEYIQTQDVHCRRYWVKPEKQKLKYLDYTMKNHALKSPRLNCEDEMDGLGYINQTLDFVRSYEFIELLQYFFTRICPLAERVALSMNPQCDTDHDVDEWDYAVAERVGSVVKCYVDGVIRATEVLLECLPEVACVKMLER